MKATILLGTLKKEEQSNTETLCEFLAGRMTTAGVESETIKLVDRNILPGTYSDMGAGDDWPSILEKLVESQAIVFATPVWWGNHSSEIQRVIERLDEIHDGILAGEKSRLDGKVGGIVVTGDSDGAQHIIGNVANFFNAVGLLLPPFCSLTVLAEEQAKGKKTPKEELLKKYEKEYAETADKMIEQFKKFAGGT
jgi:multimeric flavodoxin WrbA